MVRPHSQSARRRYYRQLEADEHAAALAAVAAQNQAGHLPQAGPPTVAQVASPAQAGPSPLSHVRHLASQIIGPSETTLHKTRDNLSKTQNNQNTLMKKNKSGNFIQYVYISCEPEKIPGILRNLSAPVPPTQPTPVLSPAPVTPSTSGGQTTGGNPVKTIPKLMDLKLSKPAGYSFASNIVSARVAKANAAQAALVKAGTLPDKVAPSTKVPFQAKAKVTIANPEPVLIAPLRLVLWGSSHFLDSRGLPAVIPRGIQFASVLNKTKQGEGKLTRNKLIEILTFLEENSHPNQLFVFLFGGNHIRDAKRGEKEIDFVKRSFQALVDRIKQMGARVVICGPIPDPIYQNIDYRFLDLGHALSTLDFGPLGNYLDLRPSVLNSQGNIREDCYWPQDIHLSKFGAQVVGSTINRLLKQIVRSTQASVVQIPTPQIPIPNPIQVPQVPIVETEEYLAGVFLRVRGYPISPPPQPLPPPTSEMEVDAPVHTEHDVAPDYPESDQNDMDINDKDESNNSVEVVESDSESIVHDSEKLMPTFYPKIKLVLCPQDELAGPSISSNVVQAVPTDSVAFTPVRASTPTQNSIPTPDLEMLDQTSDSVRSVASHVSTLNATNLLADNDMSMIGQNETIVTRMKKLQPIVEETEEEFEPDLVDVPEINGPSGSQEPESENTDKDDTEWTLVSHKRSKK
jgi:uncharacterized protein YwbE